MDKLLSSAVRNRKITKFVILVVTITYVIVVLSIAVQGMTLGRLVEWICPEGNAERIRN